MFSPWSALDPYRVPSPARAEFVSYMAVWDTWKPDYPLELAVHVSLVIRILRDCRTYDGGSNGSANNAPAGN